MDIETLEGHVDRQFLSVPLPIENRHMAIWYCLTVTEDVLRNQFDDTEGMTSRALAYLVDQTKYSMKVSLTRIFRECHDLNAVPLPRAVLPKFYSGISAIFVAGLNFAQANRYFAALHTGTASISQRSPTAIEVDVDPMKHDPAFGALEILAVQTQVDLDFATLLLRWMRLEESRPKILQEIADRTNFSGGLAQYTYNPFLARLLSQEMSQQDYLIPQEWQFPWGGRMETTLMMNALSIRALYHLVAVHFGATSQNIRGGGHEVIVLVGDLSQLVADIALFSSLPEKKIGQFVQALTYGSKTQTPDPALQPILRVGPKRFALPCLHWLSNNVERNLLTLFARTSSKSFDAQSHLFEMEMVERFLRRKSPENSVKLSNKTLVATSSGSEEFDGLLIDERARTILVCEFRWMLQPGDAREVTNRRAEAVRKVKQCERKARWLRQNLAKVLVALELRAELDWKIVGIVSLLGFGGIRSPTPEIPVIPFNLFLEAMALAEDVNDLASWCLSDEWIPQMGMHFTRGKNEFDLGDAGLVYVDGVSVITSGDEFFSHALRRFRGP